jgi:threonine dehydrogenase-like Zn-dependent dehydrogenase
MMAALYNGKESVKVGQVPVPLVTDPTDAVIRVTASTVCGSDLHLYHGLIPGMKDGDIIGHESIGIVDEVGPQVKHFKVGDRVVISAIISCGQCEYCRRREWSCCETTNPQELQTELYGHHIGALFGFSRTFGGYDGCQAEYVRVPFADVNLFPIPKNITDKEAILVADIACTGFHGATLADVKNGESVVVFGCGPVGLMAQMWSHYKGASIVVAIDVDQQRLDFAKEKFGSTIINSKDEDPLEAVQRLIPGGPDKIIDCVGFRFPDGFFHKLEMKLGLETDSPNIVNLAIKMVRKNGRITLIGDYVAYTNHFNLGALMEKHLTMNGGQLWPHNYYQEIFEAMASGKVNATAVLTHTFPMSKFDEVYKKFNKHEDGILKAYILPDNLYEKLHGETSE